MKNRIFRDSCVEACCAGVALTYRFSIVESPHPSPPLPTRHAVGARRARNNNATHRRVMCLVTSSVQYVNNTQLITGLINNFSRQKELQFGCQVVMIKYDMRRLTSNVHCKADHTQLRLTRHVNNNNKLRYRREHSASVVLSWFTWWNFSGENLLIVESLCYLTLKNAWSFLHSSGQHTSTWRTDGQICYN